MSTVQIPAGTRPGHHRARTPPGGGAIRFAGLVLVWLLLLSAAAVLVLAVLAPRIAGATPYTVLTGSMSPTYPPGTLIVARPVDADQIAIGNVITFQLVSGDPTVATHRVVAVARNAADGQLRVQTKGDANDATDVNWVRPEQIRGALWYSVPYVGYVGQLLTGEQRQLGVVVIAVGLLLYATTMFAGALRARRRHRRSA